MIKAFLNGILKMITSLVGLLLSPINAIFANVFPNMSQAISAFTTFINTYLNVGGLLSFFFSLFPPIFKNMLILWFTFVVAYYGIYYTYLAAIRVMAIIQKIKFW